MKYLSITLKCNQQNIIARDCLTNGSANVSTGMSTLFVYFTQIISHCCYKSNWWRRGSNDMQIVVLTHNVNIYLFDLYLRYPTVCGYPTDEGVIGHGELNEVN